MAQTTVRDQSSAQVLATQTADTLQQIPQVSRRDWVVSRYEKTTSLLLAASMFVAMLVALLFLLWLTSGAKPTEASFTPDLKPSSGGGAVSDTDRQFETPETKDVQELLEPSMEHRLSAITEVASTVAASFESAKADLNAQPTSNNQSHGRSGPREGDLSGAHNIGLGHEADIIPRYQRWKLRFVAKDSTQYSRQLDFYGIELAAIGGEIQGVDYAANLSSAPVTRRGPSKDEKRLYFMWTSSSPLARFDQQLLRKAGVELRERQILKFIPRNLENLLAQFELEYANSQGVSSIAGIAETVFESKQSEGGYRFEVVSQAYRTPQK